MNGIKEEINKSKAEDGKGYRMPLVEQLVEDVKDIGKLKWKKYSEERPDVNRTIIVLVKGFTYYSAKKTWQMIGCKNGNGQYSNEVIWRSIFDDNPAVFEYWMYPPEFPE